MKIAKEISNPIGTRVTVWSDNLSANVSGIDYGPNLTLHAVDKRHLVLKAAGHSGWSGVGHREYVPSQFICFEILTRVIGEGRTEYRVKPLVMFSSATEYVEEVEL